MSPSQSLESAYGPEAYDVLLGTLARSRAVARWGEAVFGTYLGQASHTEIAHVDRLIQEAAITERTRILELGAGSGGIGCYIAGATDCVFDGLDWSRVGVQLANARARAAGLAGRATFHQVDVHRPSVVRGEYDVVFTIDGTFLDVDFSRLVLWVNRVLRRGGRFAALTTWRTDDSAHRGTVPPGIPSEATVRETLAKANIPLRTIVDLTASYADLVARMTQRWRDDLPTLRHELGPRLADDRLVEDECLLSLLHTGAARRVLSVAERPQ
jgi:cyclopropane fatty-acyl-phospholipid synthase-like methyltransferase